MFSDFRYPQNRGNDYALRDAYEPIMMILAAAAAAAVGAHKTPPGGEKHHGSEGRRSIKIAPKNRLT